MSRDDLRPMEKRLVRVAFDLIAVQVDVRIEKFVRVLIPQTIQLV
jgi:hypothetical protein